MPGHLSRSISGTSCISAYPMCSWTWTTWMASHCVSWQMWPVLWKDLRERVRRLSRQDWMLTAFIYIWWFENSWHAIFDFDSQAPLLEDEVPAAGLGHLRWRFLTGFVECPASIWHSMNWLGCHKAKLPKSVATRCFQVDNLGSLRPSKTRTARTWTTWVPSSPETREVLEIS